MSDSLRKVAREIQKLVKQTVFRNRPEEKATRGGDLNQAIGLHVEDRREEPSDLRTVLLHLKCPAVKHSFPLPDLAF